MEKNLSLVQLAALPDTLSVKEMMLTHGGDGTGTTINVCLLVTAGKKTECKGDNIAVKVCQENTYAVVSCSGTPAIVVCAPGVNAVKCMGISATACSSSTATVSTCQVGTSAQPQT